jgi:EAL and modified HD-GYP domain-containing signal transduction protein
MAHTVLGDVSLGYQFLWNPLRQLGGIHLFVGTEEDIYVDAPHLLKSLGALWSEQAPLLILSIKSHTLLRDLLELSPPHNIWLEIDQAHLADSVMVRRVHQAHQHGVMMVWRGNPGERVSEALAYCFKRQMINLTAAEALVSLRVSLRRHNNDEPLQTKHPKSPVVADQIYESVASHLLAEHCLDEQGAWGVAGWPTEEVLLGYRHQRIQPGRQSIIRLVEAIDADHATDHIEHILSHDPILFYRFLRYANSACLSLRVEIDSLRHALMVLGVSLLRSWLLEQLPHASSDMNLQPVRAAMVIRSDLMAQLLDVGDGDDLRREIYQCGLLSQIDLLLGEPLETALARLPLSERVTSAILKQDGPYSPYLEVATALESPHTQTTRRLCLSHHLELETVNRALLRTLSSPQDPFAKGHFLA